MCMNMSADGDRLTPLGLLDCSLSLRWPMKRRKTGFGMFTVKRAALLILSLAFASSGSGALVSVAWNADSYSGWEVTLTGTGLFSGTDPVYGPSGPAVGWTGVVTSPSGLWQLDTVNTCYYPALGLQLLCRR